jgi:hypothetical protein
LPEQEVVLVPLPKHIMTLFVANIFVIVNPIASNLVKVSDRFREMVVLVIPDRVTLEPFNHETRSLAQFAVSTMYNFPNANAGQAF